MAPIGEGISDRTASRRSTEWNRSVSSPTVSLPQRRAGSIHGSMRGPVRRVSRRRISSRGGRSAGMSTVASRRASFSRRLMRSASAGDSSQRCASRRSRSRQNVTRRPSAASYSTQMSRSTTARVAQQAHLAPQLVHAGLGRRADQPLDAVVDRVALALPGGHQPAGEVVHLVDARPVAVHLRVAAGAQAGDAAADDRQGLARGGWSVDWHEDLRRSAGRGGEPRGRLAAATLLVAQGPVKRSRAPRPHGRRALPGGFAGRRTGKASDIPEYSRS